MPSNANRWAHLYAHAAGRYRVAPDRALILALNRHPDWPLCAGGCGWPVNPAAGATHPNCPTDTID